MLDLEPIKARLAAATQQAANDSLGPADCAPFDLLPDEYHFHIRAPADVDALVAEVERLRAEAQRLYTELYDTCMSESAWEQCDRLRVEWPQYEAGREQEP